MTLIDYQRCFQLSYDEFIQQHAIQPNQIHAHLRYEKITDVSRIDLAGGAYFFFKDGTLKMIYISGDELAQTIWNEFNRTNPSAPEETVRSRAGKTSNQLIYSGKGITASVKKDEVDFLEIYAPCSLQDYLEHVYEEPQRFIR